MCSLANDNLNRRLGVESSEISFQLQTRLRFVASNLPLRDTARCAHPACAQPPQPYTDLRSPAAMLAPHRLAHWQAPVPFQVASPGAAGDPPGLKPRQHHDAGIPVGSPAARGSLSQPEGTEPPIPIPIPIPDLPGIGDGGPIPDLPGTGGPPPSDLPGIGDHPHPRFPSGGPCPAGLSGGSLRTLRRRRFLPPAQADLTS